MDKYRLITSIAALFLYLFIVYPRQVIIISAILITAYLILKNLNINTTEYNAKANRRRNALKIASIYLSPYKDIWGNLKLSNKYCSLHLGSKAGTIIARDMVNQNRSFRIISSKIHSYDDLWDMFCVSFNHNTTFDELAKLSDTFKAVINIHEINTSNNEIQPQNNKKSPIIGDYIKKDSLLDVNNASEIELTSLPGVSIVLAKKLIKKREEIGGFKSVEEVCLFLHLKPHMQNQLEKLICVEKMKGSIQLKRYIERNIDL